MLSNKSHLNNEVVSLTSSYVKQKQLEVKEASERLLQVEEEQRQKERDLEKVNAKLQLTKQRTERNANVPEEYNGRLAQRNLPVKLKGVDLPKFSGENKAD